MNSYTLAVTHTLIKESIQFSKTMGCALPKDAIFNVSPLLFSAPSAEPEPALRRPQAPAFVSPMTRSSMEVRHLNKRLSKRLKAKAAVNRAALSKQFFQSLLAKSLLKGRGLAIRSSSNSLPLPLPWLALLVHTFSLCLHPLVFSLLGVIKMKNMVLLPNTDNFYLYIWWETHRSNFVKVYCIYLY